MMTGELSVMRMEDFLAGLSEQKPTKTSKILPEAAIARLKEAADRIAADIPFNKGDVVTIRSDAPILGHGDPYIVTDIIHDAPLFAGGEIGGWPYSTRHNVIIVGIHGDHIATHACPHWMLEPFAG